jgi:glycosyltransferase involved in cell wall biosynthesis
MQTALDAPLKVLHFVTGGFSGATQVAVDLCLAAQASGEFQVQLVLRRKRNTDAARVQALRDKGLDVRVVPGWLHAATIWQLRSLCKAWSPDILIAHGFSEHLWGRLAALSAGVPHMVHVEHNSRERYSFLRLRLARWLARHTDAIVGVSEGVKTRLLELGFPSAKCLAIPNGVNVPQLQSVPVPAWPERLPHVIMASRFARQKDPMTLIQALRVLHERRIPTRLAFAGLGKPHLIRKCQQAASRAGLMDSIDFLGQVSPLPQLLGKHQIFVLSTHYEGMPLALIEAMAMGCACVATDVVGVREVIDHGRTGLLVPEGDACALADAIAQLLDDPARAEKMGLNAQAVARENFDLAGMHASYTALILQLVSRKPTSATGYSAAHGYDN